MATQAPSFLFFFVRATISRILPRFLRMPWFLTHRAKERLGDEAV